MFDRCEKNTSVYENIQKHLSFLLNTRQGSLAHMPDYGMPDIVQLYQELPGAKHRLLMAMKNTIQKYEPRLTELQLMLIENKDLTHVLRIIISGTLKNGKRLNFTSNFISGGNITIKKKTP